MDAKQFAEHKKNCEQCNRHGLLILPVLQEIAPIESRAPKLSGPFNVAENIPLDEKTNTIYTLRMVRPGFLYVYDPIQKTRDGRPNPWQGYIVSNLGFLTPYTAWQCNPNMDEPPPCDPYNCGMLARCISIRNPEKPREIWIGFSDTKWTMDVLKENEKAAVRNRHMRRFDVGQWWASQTHDHACQLNQCKNHVLEMAQNVDTNCLEYSTIPLNTPRPVLDVNAMLKRVNEARAKKGEPPHPTISYPVAQDKAGLLLHEFPRLGIPVSPTDPIFQARPPETQLLLAAERVMGEENKHKAAVVALEDPAGILMELAVYMDYRHGQFESKLMGTNEFGRKFYIASAITGLENAVKNNVLAAIEETAHSKPVALTPFTGGVTFNYGLHAQAHDIYYDNERLKAIQDDKWKKYAKKFDPDAIKTTREEYNNKLADFDQANIAPLAAVWVKWFKSERYVASMECNHDSKNQDSGVAYTQLVSLCVGGCQNKLPVIKELIAQLQAGATDLTQVLSRAFVFNQDAFATAVESAVAQVGSEADLEKQVNNWGKAISEVDALYDTAMKNTTLMSTRNDALSRLTGQVIGAALNLMDPAIAKGPVPKWLAKLGLAARMPIVKIELVGTVSEIADMLADHYAKFVKGADKRLLRKSFELRLQKSYKKPGVQKITVYAGVDETKMANALKNAGDSAQKTAAVSSNARLIPSWQRGLRQNQIPVSEFSSADAILMNKSPNTVEVFSRSKTTGKVVLPAAAGIITAGLNIWMLNSAGEVLLSTAKNDGATPAQINEARASFVGVSALSLYGMSEAVETMAKAAPRLARFAPGLFVKYGTFLKFATRGVGAVGGGIIAVVDFKEAVKAVNNEQYGLAAAYFLTAASGIVPAVLLAISVVAPILGFAAFGAAAYGLLSAAWVFWPLLIIALAGGILWMIFTDDDMEAWLGKCIFGKYSEKFRSLDEEVKGLRKLGFDASISTN